jgi:PAS domain S-box-containing protein
MDAPVFVSGSLQGVLRCRERPIAARPWNQDERTFAVAVANLVAGILAHVRTRDAERTLRDFLENANDMVVFLTPEGRYEYVNQTWCDAIGYTPEEARSLTWPQIIAPEALPALHPVWRRYPFGRRCRSHRGPQADQGRQKGRYGRQPAGQDRQWSAV